MCGYCRGTRTPCAPPSPSPSVWFGTSCLARPSLRAASLLAAVTEMCISLRGMAVSCGRYQGTRRRSWTSRGRVRHTRTRVHRVSVFVDRAPLNIAVWRVCVPCSPSSRLLPATGQLISGSWDGTAIVWDITTGTKIVELQGHENAVGNHFRLTKTGASRYLGKFTLVTLLFDGCALELVHSLVYSGVCSRPAQR